MLDYNVPLGKLNRGMAVLDAVRAVATDKEITDEQALQARIVGWCIEFVSDVTTSHAVNLFPSLACPGPHLAPGLGKISMRA